VGACVAAVIWALLIGCTGPTAPVDEPFATAHDERWRPQLHYSPATQWMNDPAGLVYFEGEWHLFFQHNPDDILWGPMHWGHAVSTDLVHWQHLPIALSPDDVLGQVYTGSVVVDEQDSSGLCAGESCLVAVFTHHGGDSATQKQSVAFSVDRGRSWTLHDGNPVVEESGLQHFRDPKVFRHEDGWRMVVAAGDRVKLYGSDDLLAWTWLSDFAADDLNGGVWECPDLLPLALDGETHWVLSVDTNPGGPQGGSGSWWFLGDFDGTTFNGSLQGPADWGADFYASQSFSGAPDDRTVWLGWMDNWQYAMLTPTTPWRGAASLPRELRLENRGSDVVLTQWPVAELDGQRGRLVAPLETVSDEAPLLIEATLLAGEAEVGFDVFSTDTEKLSIGWRGFDSELFVDRSLAGDSRFHADFSARHTVNTTDRLQLDVTIVIDRSSVEVFADGGAVVLTDRFFALGSERTVVPYGPIEGLRITQMRSGWEPE